MESQWNHYRAPVAMWAVNQGVVRSNPSSANIIYDVWQKSLWQASFVFHHRANSLCGKAASCLESMLCGVLVWENQETYEEVNWLPWYDWKIVENGVKPQSINLWHVNLSVSKCLKDWQRSDTYMCRWHKNSTSQKLNLFEQFFFFPQCLLQRLQKD